MKCEVLQEIQPIVLQIPKKIPIFVVFLSVIQALSEFIENFKDGRREAQYNTGSPEITVSLLLWRSREMQDLFHYYSSKALPHGSGTSL